MIRQPGEAQVCLCDTPSMSCSHHNGAHQEGAHLGLTPPGVLVLMMVSVLSGADNLITVL